MIFDLKIKFMLGSIDYMTLMILKWAYVSIIFSIIAEISEHVFFLKNILISWFVPPIFTKDYQ